MNLIKRYNLIYVEDPLHEEDFQGFKELTESSKNCLICGDDLYVTNVKRLTKGKEIRAGNSIIIKMNQVGTLTEAWQATKMAQQSNYIPIVSHRSGETTAVDMAHLAVAFNAPIIKAGVVGGERVAKLNELLHIKEILGKKGKMAKLELKEIN